MHDTDHAGTGWCEGRGPELQPCTCVSYQGCDGYRSPGANSTGGTWQRPTRARLFGAFFPVLAPSFERAVSQLAGDSLDPSSFFQLSRVHNIMLTERTPSRIIGRSAARPAPPCSLVRERGDSTGVGPRGSAGGSTADVSAGAPVIFGGSAAVGSRAATGACDGGTSASGSSSGGREARRGWSFGGCSAANGGTQRPVAAGGVARRAEQHDRAECVVACGKPQGIVVYAGELVFGRRSTLAPARRRRDADGKRRATDITGGTITGGKLEARS